MSTDTYTVIGVEESPYSVKVRSYFRYKDIPHSWRGRSEAGELFQRHARLPLIPLVVTPDDRGIQDSPPTIEAMEPVVPNPPIHPEGTTAGFVSALLEEFGDEWGNKWMFHFRWAREVDQRGCARRLALASNPSLEGETLDTMSETIRSRMVDRVWFVGSNSQTAPQIEESFAQSMAILDQHLEGRDYVFGARPAFADFGLWGQIYNANRDHTPAQILKSHSNVLRWVESMLQPTDNGPYEPWADVEPTLTPLIRDQVAGMFLPWSVANAQAIGSGADEFEVEIASGMWKQKPQKYHARSLGVLKQKYSDVANDAELNDYLENTGCLRYLQD